MANKTKVIFIQLNGAVHVPQIVQVEKDRSMQELTHPGIVMSLFRDTGVKVLFKGKTFIIPFHKITSIILE